MKIKDALARLESLGTAQNRKVYARHGVRGAQYGVSFANLGKLAKEWRGEHELALALWGSGNHDARVLATMIADAARLTRRELEAWARDLDSYVLTEALGRVAARSPAAAQLTSKWIASANEWIATSGWNVLAQRLHAGEAIPASELRPRIAEIEKNVHRAKNRVRYAMNGALIAIGVASAELREDALAAAERIGTVEVDHGETGCKTPDAAEYIRRTLAHRKAKAAGKKPAGARKKASASR